VRNDLLMNFLASSPCTMIMLSLPVVCCGLYLLAPLALSNIIVTGTWPPTTSGEHPHAAPGDRRPRVRIDYGLYIVSRTIEEIRVRGEPGRLGARALETSARR